MKKQKEVTSVSDSMSSLTSQTVFARRRSETHCEWDRVLGAFVAVTFGGTNIFKYIYQVGSAPQVCTRVFQG